MVKRAVTAYRVLDFFFAFFCLVLILSNLFSLSLFTIQAGHILSIHSKHKPRMIRWLFWAVLMVSVFDKYICKTLSHLATDLLKGKGGK